MTWTILFQRNIWFLLVSLFLQILSRLNSMYISNRDFRNITTRSQTTNRRYIFLLPVSKRKTKKKYTTVLFFSLRMKWTWMKFLINFREMRWEERYSLSSKMEKLSLRSWWALTLDRSPGKFMENAPIGCFLNRRITGNY